MLRLWFIFGWPICSVFLHAEFVDLQAESKFVAYSNSIDYSGHSIGEAFYHADTFVAINRNVMPLPARATGTHGLPSGITPSQAPTLGGVAERYGASTSASRLGGHGAPHQGTSQLGSISEHQASHASGVSGGGVSKAPSTENPLDWSIYHSKTTKGDTAHHIRARHEQLNLRKADQGVFYGDSVKTVEETWGKVQKQGIKPSVIDGNDYYVVPRSNAGYAGGIGGQRTNYDYVTIVTKKDSNQIITAYPSGSTPPFPKEYAWLFEGNK